MTENDLNTVPPKPERAELDESDDTTQLANNIREALHAVPFYFESKTMIEGLDARDLFSLNSVLGGTIEVQTVSALNRLRTVWDPDEKWADYGFERFSQTFPDVRLVNRRDVTAQPLLGLELKGWYLLSKEKEPSYRYTATRDACSTYDLLVVVPWHLSDVLSGAPVILDPFIEQARYAAEMRNYYWQYQRRSGAETGIESPEGVHPYPLPKTKTSDKALRDNGNNFGRIARVPDLMKDFSKAALETRISGIECNDWIDFFKVFTEASDRQKVDEELARLLTRRRRNQSAISEHKADRIIEHLKGLQSALSDEPEPE